MTPPKTPESKLLELIRKRPGAHSPIRNMAAWAWLRGFVDGLVNSLKSRRWTLTPLQIANRALLGVLTGTGVYFGYCVFKKPLDSRLIHAGMTEETHAGMMEGLNAEMADGKNTETAAGVEAKSKEGSLWSTNGIRLSEITGRNLFEPLLAPEPPKPAAAPAAAVSETAPRVSLRQRGAHLKLVGILGGSPPQAMIEDSRSHKVLYVTPGDFIDEIQVEKVFIDKVILFFEEERMELSF